MPLSEILRRQIEVNGPMTVAEFMAAGLLHPEHGYYMQENTIGFEGDFVTAPEISQMFGELIGLWCIVAWRQMGSPSPVMLVELGPGRGTLMSDALRAMRMAPDFMECADIHLVEVSPELRACQREALAVHGVKWHGGLEDIPDGPILLIANEFLDTLPIRQLVRRGQGWHERLVSCGDDGFQFVLDAAPSPLAALLPETLADEATQESIVEISPAVLGVASAVAQRIALAGGAALFLDYGHAETRPGDTLQAIRGHCYADALTEPGFSDLTAHVDFGAFGRAAHGVSTHGPVDQGVFLKRIGIEERGSKLIKAAVERRESIEGALRRLTGSDEMGRLFKVVAFTGRDMPVPAGFESRGDCS